MWLFGGFIFRSFYIFLLGLSGLLDLCGHDFFTLSQLKTSLVDAINGYTNQPFNFS